jgi:surfactin synthase thioesterase subunit
MRIVNSEYAHFGGYNYGKSHGFESLKISRFNKVQIKRLTLASGKSPASTGKMEHAPDDNQVSLLNKLGFSNRDSIGINCTY